MSKKQPLLDTARDDRANIKEGTGTRLSSVFTLINAAIGTGMLTIPYSFDDAGIIPGIIWVVFYGIAAAGSLHVLVKSAHVSCATSLPQLLGTYLGGNVRFIFEVCLIIYCLLSCVGSFIVCADVATPVFSRLLPTTVFADPTFGPIVIKCCAALLMLPLQFLRRINSLRFTAYLAFVSIIYVIVLVIWHGVLRFPSALKAGSQVKWFNPSAPWYVFFAVPNVAIAFQCQIQVVSIYSEMKASVRSVAAMTTSILGAVVIEVALYTCAGLFGYITFLDCTPSNVLKANYSVTDYPVELARLCICIVMVTQFPINHFPARKAIYTSLLKCPCMRPDAHKDPVGLEECAAQDSPEVAPRLFSPAEQPAKKISLEALPCCFFYTESILFWAVSLVLALVIPSLSVLFEILGFSMTMFIMFIIPGVVLWRSTNGMHRVKRRQTYKALGVCLTVLGVFSAVVCACDFAADEIVPLVTGGAKPNMLNPNCSSLNASIPPLFG